MRIQSIYIMLRGRCEVEQRQQQLTAEVANTKQREETLSYKDEALEQLKLEYRDLLMRNTTLTNDIANINDAIDIR